jgi:RNA polymerase sigma-70 factor, ECF subfamily
VLRALAAVPPEQRRALVLGYFGGLSQREIAERLSWPLGTVKKRVRLGLEKLRASLAGEVGVEEGERRSIAT